MGVFLLSFFPGSPLDCQTVEVVPFGFQVGVQDARHGQKHADQPDEYEHRLSPSLRSSVPQRVYDSHVPGKTHVLVIFAKHFCLDINGGIEVIVVRLAGKNGVRVWTIRNRWHQTHDHQTRRVKTTNVTEGTKMKNVFDMTTKFLL